MCLAIILLISLIISIFGSSLMVFLYSGIYQAVLDKNNVYGLIEQGLSKEGQLDFTNIGEETPKVFTDRMIDNFLSYVRGDSDNPDLTIRLKKEAILNLFTSKIDKIRICNNGEDPFNANAPCRPYNKNSSEFLNEYLKENNINFLEQDTINLLDILDPDRNITKLRNIVLIYKKIIYITIFISLLSILLIILFNIKENHKGLRWIGIPFILAGSIAIFSSKFIGEILKETILSNIPNFALFIADFISYYLNLLIYVGAGVITFGVILFIASFLMKAKKLPPKN